MNRTTSTGMHRAVAERDDLNVIVPLADALRTMVASFAPYRLTSDEGSEQAARLVQALLASRGWFLTHDGSMPKRAAGDCPPCPDCGSTDPRHATAFGVPCSRARGGAA